MGWKDRLRGTYLSLPAHLRPSRRSAAAAGRLHVIGNCQAQAVAHAMRALLPEREVMFVSAFGIATRFPRMTDLVAATGNDEAVFATAFSGPFRDGGGFEDLRRRTRLIQIPTVVFPAFHPDAIYVGSEEGGHGLVYGPMGGYHSALALYAYLEGFGTEAALRLFEGKTFRRLGYLDLWEPSVATLAELGHDAGYPLDADILRWSRRGAFMHGINHPKMYVAADLARGLLAKAGIPFEDADLDTYLPDDFIRSGTWPVYPAIGEHYGVPASELFLKAPTLKTGPARTLSLRTFVEASFASYGKRDRARLVSARVEGWRADAALRTDLAGLARA